MFTRDSDGVRPAHAAGHRFNVRVVLSALGVGSIAAIGLAAPACGDEMPCAFNAAGAPQTTAPRPTEAMRAGPVSLTVEEATRGQRQKPPRVSGRADTSGELTTSVEFTVLSQGRSANPASCGGVAFRRDGATFHAGRGCIAGSVRGWNVAAVDRATGDVLGPVRNFDTWHAGESAATAMIEFLDRQPAGTLLLIAVGDEAGLTIGRSSGCPANPAPGSVCCGPLGGEFARLRLTLDALGARRLAAYCYWNSYALVTIKGMGAQQEALAKSADAIVRHTLASK